MVAVRLINQYYARFGEENNGYKESENADVDGDVVYISEDMIPYSGILLRSAFEENPSSELNIRHCMVDKNVMLSLLSIVGIVVDCRRRNVDESKAYWDERLFERLDEIIVDKDVSLLRCMNVADYFGMDEVLNLLTMRTAHKMKTTSSAGRPYNFI